MYMIEAMTQKNAERIAKWKYPEEYAVYSFEFSQETLAELMGGEYFSCTNAQGRLVGYFCFGNAARIPTETGYAAGPDRLDIGLGLLPELCGCGYGKGFMQSGLHFARHRLNATGLRLVVAEFNKRAIKLYHSCGFAAVETVAHKNNKMNFIVMDCSL